MPQSDLINWLLSAKTPSIRYLTARDLLGLPVGDPYMNLAQQAIMTNGPVPAIFDQQTASGQWADEHSYYTPKYVSTHWNLTLLTELCVQSDDMRFQRGVEYMLSTTVRDNLMISCFRGNLLRYALQAGRADDPRVRVLVDKVVKDISGGYCRCQHNSGYSCAWGVVRALWGLAVLPERQAKVDIQVVIDQALHFLLDLFSLTKANYPIPENGKVHPMWFKLNFPLFYQADILFTLRVLAELDALRHPNAAPALDWLEAQRLPDGRWHGSSPFRQRTWRALGDSIETERWVTLQSTLILQRAGRLNYASNG